MFVPIALTALVLLTLIVSMVPSPGIAARAH
jgi:hypothetical protein